MEFLAQEIRHIIFDWGNTLMRDFPEKPGAMCDWDHVELMPGVISLLEYLHEKYTLTVATNAGVSDTAKMRKALQRSGIDHYFTYFFSSKDLGVNKPDPDFFRKICSLTAFAENESLMIGNDFGKDIQGALSAGLQAIWYNHENGAEEKATGMETVKNLEEIRQLI